jgi:Ni/Co efflux regulator RcnB
MKRPVTLAIVATLLVTAPAFAGDAFQSRVAKGVEKVARHENQNRGNDHRGNDNRGHDNRGNRGHDRSPPNHGGGKGSHDRGKDHGNNGGNDHRNDHRYDNRPDHRYDTRHDNRSDNRGWDRPRSDWSNHPRYWDNRRHDRRDYARYRYNYGHYHAPRGYHYRVWHRGDYLPRAYYGSSYVVYDYAPYRLYAPPYGYHWVRVGNDVLLTALATGVVLDVLYNIWY